MCNWLSNYDIATRAEHRCRCGCTIDRRYIYKKCKEFEITSNKFAVSIKELIKVSDDHHIQLHKIEEYIDEKITKKKELENELEDLKNEISTLKNQKSEIEMSETWPCSKRKWQI